MQREFEKVIRQSIQKLSGQNTTSNAKGANAARDSKRDGIVGNESGGGIGIAGDTTTIQDLEEVSTSVIPTVSHHVSLTNGHLRPHVNNTTSSANNKKLPTTLNGHIPNGKGRSSFRNMLDEAENYPIDSHI